MRDKKKEATFSGNVKVVQGDTTVSSKSWVVLYDSARRRRRPPLRPPPPKASKSRSMQSATPGPGGSSSIRRLEARGSVVVTQKDQVVTGETAIFDPRANLITMAGGVVLTQCKNVLKGDRLKVDMSKPSLHTSRCLQHTRRHKGSHTERDCSCTTLRRADRQTPTAHHHWSHSQKIRYKINVFKRDC